TSASFSPGSFPGLFVVATRRSGSALEILTSIIGVRSGADVQLPEYANSMTGASGNGCPPRDAGTQGPSPLTCGARSSADLRYSEMSLLRTFFLGAATLMFISVSMVAHAQYYYGPPQGYRPPCAAVTPGPLQGAGRGAAGGALIGAISGNAGRGAAIGAGFGALRGAIRRGSARSAGVCY